MAAPLAIISPARPPKPGQGAESQVFLRENRDSTPHQQRSGNAVAIDLTSREAAVIYPAATTRRTS